MFHHQIFHNNLHNNSYHIYKFPMKINEKKNSITFVISHVPWLPQVGSIHFVNLQVSPNALSKQVHLPVTLEQIPLGELQFSSHALSPNN